MTTSSQDTAHPMNKGSDAERLCSLLDEAAAHDHRRTADALEALRNRLGRDGLDMEEWNALVGAASHLRIEAWRRESRALTKVEDTE